MGEKYRSLLLAGTFLIGLSLGMSSSVIAGDLEDAIRAYSAGEFQEAATLFRPLVREGNAQAQYYMGRMLEQGDGVEKNADEAVRLYRLATEQGYQDAARRLEQFAGKDTGENSVVLEWYLPAAQEGDQDAQYSLGYMYETGWGVAINETEARRWYREAVASGHDMAQLRLGLMLITGAGGNANVAEGTGLLRSAADTGNRLAEAILQDMIDLGDISAESRDKVIEGLRRTFEEDVDRALETLFVSLERVRNRAAGGRQPRRAAKTDSTKESSRRTTKVDAPPADQLEVAPVIKPETDSVSTVMPAVTVFTGSKASLSQSVEAAEQGNADAQVALGIRYLQGDGVRQNLQEGLRWIREAAAQGHQVAQTYLSLWTTQFEDLLVNSSIGLTWLMEAGRQWDLDALYQLGVLFETGRGVKRSLPDAQKWFQLAAAMGHADARKGLQRLQTGSPGGFSTLTDLGSRSAAERPWWLWVIAFVMIGLLIRFGFRLLGNWQPRWKVPAPIKKSGMEAARSGKKSGFGIGMNADDEAFLNELWGEHTAKTESIVSDEIEKSDKDSKPKGLTPEQAESLKAGLSLEEPSVPAVSNADDVANLTSLGDIIPERMPPKSEALEDRLTSVRQEADISIPSVAADKPTPSGKDDTAGEIRVEARLPESKSGLNADDLMHSRDGISKDALASSRLDADEFFSQPFPLDSEGKVVHRTQKETGRLQADQFEDLPLSTDQKSSTLFELDVDKSPPPAREPVAGVGITDEYSSTVFERLSDEVDLSGPGDQAENTVPAEDHAIDEEIIDANSEQASSSLPEPAEEQSDKESGEETDTGTVDLPGHAIVSDEPLQYDDHTGLDDDEVPSEFSEDNDTELNESEEMALAEVHFNIGNMFASGDGVSQSDEMAAKWFQRAAEKGLAAAQFALAECLFAGQGLEKDDEQGLFWLEKAADQGHEAAMLRLKQNRA